MNNSFIVGVDIGGSHITAALVESTSRRVLDDTWTRRLLNTQDSAPQIISAWSSVIEQCCAAYGVVPGCIGMAMPGPFDYQEGISYIRNQNKNDALYGVNVKQALAGKLGIDAGLIRFINDAAAFLKGEVFGGGARGHATALGITLGTGFGSAYYRNKEATDANLWCAPFRDGIAEDYFSTRWFVQRYREITGREVYSVRQLAALYPVDSRVTELFEEFGDNLAAYLGQLMQQKAYDVIVMGGGIAECFEQFVPTMRKRLAASGLPAVIRKSVLGEKAALLGAASCWEE